MFDYLRFRWKLGQLERDLRQTDNKYEADIKAARQRKASADDVDSIEHAQMSEHFLFRDEIQTLHSRYLSTQASRLIIPRPPLGDETMWEKDGLDRHILSEAGINHLRAAIRAERKARLELFLMWVPGVVGILGALIGLVAMLIGRR